MFGIPEDLQHIHDQTGPDGYTSIESETAFAEESTGWEIDPGFKKESTTRLVNLANSRVKLSHLFDLYKIRFEEVYSPSGWTKRCSCPLPNHRDSSPSFGFNPEGEYFNCFGCGSSGKAVQFKSKMDGITIREAAEILIDAFGIGYDSLEIENIEKYDHKIDKMLLDFSNFIRNSGKDYSVLEKITLGVDVYIQKHMPDNSINYERLAARIELLKEKL